MLHFCKLSVVRILPFIVAHMKKQTWCGDLVLQVAHQGEKKKKKNPHLFAKHYRKYSLWTPKL